MCLIAGINGLGKTTLITMLLRAFTGPYDLTSEGLPQALESIIPEFPIILKQRERMYFAQRVADNAINATVTLTVSLGKHKVQIRRRLSDLRLLAFSIDGEPLGLGTNEKEREGVFQQQMSALFDLSSFVDVLLVLHHVVFFKEGRPGRFGTRTHSDTSSARSFSQRNLPRLSPVANVASNNLTVMLGTSVPPHIRSKRN